MATGTMRSAMWVWMPSTTSVHEGGRDALSDKQVEQRLSRLSCWRIIPSLSGLHLLVRDRPSVVSHLTSPLAVDLVPAFTPGNSKWNQIAAATQAHARRRVRLLAGVHRPTADLRAWHRQAASAPLQLGPLGLDGQSY